ncbi:MAG: ABC transporter permease [Bacteroidota bacterium]
MLKNHLTIALRVFWNRKGYVALNTLGLALGMAASILILQYVDTQQSYDGFHDDGDRIYRVQFNSYRDGGLQFESATAFPKVGPAMLEEFPEVEDYVRLFLHYGGRVVQHEARSYKEEYLFQADANFFSFFSYPLLLGDPATALAQPNTAVISEAIAQKYFGTANPLGERITIGGDLEYEITGVARSPEESHLKFNFLLSYETLVQAWGDGFDTAWGWYDFYNYIRLTPSAQPEAVEAKFPAFINKHGGENADQRTEFVLQALPDIYLTSDLIQEARINGNGTAVSFLALIALFIMGIAWINYINLSTARAAERAREIGVRKVMGAGKGQLIRQFLMESVVMNALAMLLALLLVWAALPVFSSLVGAEASYGFLLDGRFWLLLGALFVVGSALAGLYPAFVLSGYQPVQVLKGSFSRSAQGLLLRKGLVVGQFAISFALIAGTLIVFQQLQFMQQQDLGIQVEQTLVVEGPGAVDSTFVEQNTAFEEVLLQQAGIQRVAGSSEIPGNLIYWTSGARSLTSEASSILYQVGVDYDYLESYGHQVLAGRTYSPDFQADDESIILNDTARRLLGFESAESTVGQQIVVGGDTLAVAGVVADYHQEGLQKGYDPIGFRLSPNAGRYYSIKVASADLPGVIRYIGEQYQTFFPGNPYIYYFLDNHFNAQYQQDEQFGRVFTFFALLAIFVACLGLFGLSSFTAVQRTKEIGIRKVLGSSVGGIVMLLARDFLVLVLVGSLIATPVLWLTMQGWLDGFAFRIDLGIWVFVAAGVLTLLLAMLTVAYQSVRASTANPIESLRYE